ncbi:MAG: FAD-dependent monooxygenase, partial [Desulfovibrio sp.]|nr:FAD-dependent monooxygenase [Desulfovibrio sp.]
MSREYRCEALVVGAGPAGASAAKAMAQAGIDVLVLERRKVIGRPVRCAEYIPAPLARETA